MLIASYQINQNVLAELLCFCEERMLLKLEHQENCIWQYQKVVRTIPTTLESGGDASHRSHRP